MVCARVRRDTGLQKEVNRKEWDCMQKYAAGVRTVGYERSPALYLDRQGSKMDMAEGSSSCFQVKDTNILPLGHRALLGVGLEYATRSVVAPCLRSAAACTYPPVGAKRMLSLWRKKIRPTYAGTRIGDEGTVGEWPPAGGCLVTTDSRL